jgi:acetate kinase
LILDREVSLLTHEKALHESLAAMKEFKNPSLAACVHRIAHGGPRLSEPLEVDQTVRSELLKLVELAPLHLPSELAVLDATLLAYPEVPQIACFDTAFHQRMPDVAKRLPLSGDFWSRGIRRYGFHGLSYESIVSQLGEKLSGRSIIAHLGNGCSMVALKQAFPQDTTMGLTPTGGLVMGSRSGDLDPGVLFYLMRDHSPVTPKSPNTIAQAEHTLNYNSGLLGVSGMSRNMEDLLKEEEKSVSAKQAVELFCYSARKFVGALSAVLGGLDNLIFTGGIGENSPVIRKRICGGLEFLGIRVVQTLHTDENLMMAQHAVRLLSAKLAKAS